MPSDSQTVTPPADPEAAIADALEDALDEIEKVKVASLAPLIEKAQAEAPDSARS